MCKEESTIYTHYVSTYSFSWSNAKKEQLMDLFWMVTVGQCRVHEVSKQEVEWIELSDLAVLLSDATVAVCNSSDVWLRWKATERENFLPGLLPVTLLHASHVTSQLLSKEVLQKWAHSCCFYCREKKQISIYFFKSSREEGRGVAGAYIQLKKTQMSPVNTSTSMSDRDQWCVFMLVCVSQSARAASSASSREHL